MSIPLESLRELPEGASWQKSRGQAHATVQVLRDTLIITATCDSLQRLVDIYSEKLMRIRSDTVQSAATFRMEEKKHTDNLRYLITAFIAGLAAGAVLTFLIKKRI